MTLQTFYDLNKNTQAYRFSGPTNSFETLPEWVKSRVVADYEFFQTALRARDKFAKGITPLVGDYVRLAGGNLTRITAAYDNGRIQTGGGTGSSYHLFVNGALSYSGGLDSPFSSDLLSNSPDTKNGMVWAFSGAERKAHNGVSYVAEFRIFDLKPIDRFDHTDDLPLSAWPVEVTNRLYDQSLEILPPAYHAGSFFGMGDPLYYRDGGNSTYYFFTRIHGKCYLTKGTVTEARAAFATLREALCEQLNRIEAQPVN